MEIIRSKAVKDGKREVTVRLDGDEEILPLRHGGYYKLGYPIEDIVEAHHILDAVPVSWDAVEQKWVD